MKLGLSSLLFPNDPIEKAIEISADLGFKCVELVHDVPHFSPHHDVERLRRLRELMDSREVEALIHACLWDLNPMSYYPAIRELTAAGTKRGIDACRLLGGKIITVHPGRCEFKESKSHFERAKGWFRNYVRECQDYAKEREATLAIETIPFSIIYPRTTEELMRLTEDFDGLGVTLDIGHSYLAAKKDGETDPEGSIIRAIEKIKDRLVNVHLHDNRGTRDEHLAPGKGTIDLPRVVEALKDSNYSGPIILELWNPTDPLKTVNDGLEYVKTRLQLEP
jgi:sugar phosphate isomerase/epimerase